MQSNQHIVHLFVSSYGANTDYSSDGDIIFRAPRLAYVANGTCTMTSKDGQNLTINAGDVWFLPKNKPYRSSWKADPCVQFVFVEFDIDQCSLVYDKFFSIHCPEAESLFKRTQDYYESGDTFGAMAGLFEILHKFLPAPNLTNHTHSRIRPALDVLHTNYTSNISVAKLAALCAMSESHFYSVFKAAAGVSPIEYKNTLKIGQAVHLIEQGATLENVCERLNFSSPAFLRKMLKRMTGMLPKEIKRGRQKM